MKLSRSIALLCAPLALAAVVAGCSSDMNANKATTNAAATPAATASPATQTLSVVERPQKIKDQMAQRGEQDNAKPTLKITQPADGSIINGSTVKVKLALSGDLKGYAPHKDLATQMGNHIHVILDNQPYEAYYELGQPFELRNVSEGKHTLRVFPSRPWHESYKNDGAMQMATFTVKGGGDASQPTTTNTGAKVADAKNANATASPSASPAAAPEGKDMQPGTAPGEIDHTKPLLTYSRPKGEYKGADADAIMIDFWMAHGKLAGDGGEYQVRYSVDGGAPKMLDKWEPIWLTGWTAGKHTIKLELVDKSGAPVENGGFNTTTREITVVK